MVCMYVCMAWYVGGSILLASFDCPVEGHVFPSSSSSQQDDHHQQQGQEDEGGGEKEERRWLVPVTLEMKEDCILRVWVGEGDDDDDDAAAHDG